MQADLTVRAGKDVGRHYVIRLGQTFFLGRARDVSIRIDDERVSRRHTMLELKPEGLYVVDLGSRNGTFVDGKQLEPNKPTLCAVEDTLQLGDHVFHVMLVGIDERTRRERQRTQRLDEPLLPREEFEILGEIGRGATGRVYAAHQKLLRRNVAIKVLRTEVDPDAESQARFVREGRVACMIDSPHVVEVFDLRLVGDRVYLVMELVNGVSAKDRVYGGPLPVPEALKVAEDVAFALEAAHRVGVVHRDIKPANILITPQGDAKLSDFGIAKELDSLESLTSTGEGLGTLAYVSPEQATEAKTVDRRTDLYSLGATLYHLLAGMPPFIPQSARVLLQILDQPPPSLLAARPEVPPDVAALVHRLLEKDREKRPPDAASVAAELRRLRERHYPEFRFGSLTVDELADSGERTEGFGPSGG